MITHIYRRYHTPAYVSFQHPEQPPHAGTDRRDRPTCRTTRRTCKPQGFILKAAPKTLLRHQRTAPRAGRLPRDVGSSRDKQGREKVSKKTRTSPTVLLNKMDVQQHVNGTKPKTLYDLRVWLGVLQKFRAA